MLFLLIIFGFCLTWFLVSIGKKYNLTDVSDGTILKPHAHSVPCLGGIGIFLPFFIVSLIQDIPKLPLLILVFSGIFLLFGLFDDLKWKSTHKSKPLIKLIVEIILISSFLLLSIFFIKGSVSWLVLLLSLIWIGTVINAVNMSDGLDSLAAFLVLISLAGFFVIFSFTGSVYMARWAGVLFFSLLPFLFFNFPPAKIFMGDNGSHFLGFILAIWSMILVILHFSVLSVMGVCFLVGLPLLDLIFVTITRLLRGKSIIYGGRDHLYDKLMNKLNGSLCKTLLIYSLIQAIFVGSGVLLILL